MRASAAASISFSVSGVKGQVSATKSASGSSALSALIGCTSSASPARRAVEEDVVPQTGNHQDVGLADAGRERLGVAHRETPDAGPERGKPLVEPVGDMRETDDELILRRDHRGLRITEILAEV